MGWVWTWMALAVLAAVGGTTRPVSSDRAGVLEMIVRDRQTSKPVADADINVRRLPGEEWFQTHSDSDGVARLRLSPGSYKIERVFKFNQYATTQPQNIVPIAAGKTNRLQIPLDPQPKCAGVVLDRSGKPVSGACLRVLPTGLGDVITGEKGTFKIAWDPLNHRPPFMLVARHPDRNLAAVTEIPRTSQDFKLQLVSGITVTGRIVDAAGQPISGATVYLVFRTPYYDSILSDRTIKTDAKGRFQLSAVPAGGRFFLIAKADGFGRRAVPLDTLRTSKGKMDLKAVALDPSHLSLAGVVLDPKGVPVPGIRVSLFSESQPTVRTLTDSRGRFHFGNLCKGSIRLQADAREKGCWGVADVQAGDRGVTLALKPTASSTQLKK